MSDSSDQPWSNDPNAPQIPYWLHLIEEGDFSGYLISLIFYGIVVSLFCKCMNALLNPINRKNGGVKWLLVVHTTIMFSLVTTLTVINIYLLFVAYIENREFPGADGVIPGPLGYEDIISSEAPSVATNVILFLNQSLADGLLLYRFCVIYSMKYWIITFPCLMYVASVGMSIAFFYELARPDSLFWNATTVFNFSKAFWSISLSLNLIIMVLIVIRLSIHHRNIRNAMGAPGGTGGLYKAIIAMLVESFSIYAINFLLYTGPWIADNFAQYIFLPLLSQTQVIAPFLIILRVANQTALTREAIVSGNIGSIHFKSQGISTDGGNVTIADEDPKSSVDTGRENPGELGVGAEIAAIEEVPVPR